MDNIEELKSQLTHKEQEVQQAMDNYVQLDLQRVKEYNELVDLYKAKEQDCEALQMSENEAGKIIAELQAYKDVNEDFKTAWEELKAENEELKKNLNEGCLQHLTLMTEQQVLLRTLAEIKEIAETISLPMGTGNSDNRVILAKQILQKISECEVGNDDRN